MTIHTAKCIFNAFTCSCVYICELHDFMKLAGTELFSFSFDLEVVLSMLFHIPPSLGFFKGTIVVSARPSLSVEKVGPDIGLGLRRCSRRLLNVQSFKIFYSA